MRTWGLYKGHFIAIDSRKLSTEENDFQYETKIFKCNSKGQIRDWNDLYSLQYKHEKEMKEGHESLVKKWIEEKIGEKE